jgi:hypothetical protein
LRDVDVRIRTLKPTRSCVIPCPTKEIQADAPDLMSYYGELLRRVRETPGVGSASLSFKPPISNEQGSWWGRVAVEGAPTP